MAVKITLSMDEDLLNTVDKEVEKIGYGATRSGFISSVVKAYLGGQK